MSHGASLSAATQVAALAPASGGSPVTLTWRGEDHTTAAVGNATVTITGAAIGTASSDRLVIVYAGMNSVGALTCTVGGISCTKPIEDNPGSNLTTALFYANVTSGTTANIVIGSPFLSNIGVISWWTLTGATATPTGSAKTTYAYSIGGNISLTVPTNGVAVASVTEGCDNSGACTTLTNVTLDVDTHATLTTSNSYANIGGHNTTVGAVSPTVAAGGGNYGSILGATWGP